MVKIIIPDNNINERKYIIDIFFSEILGIEYALVISNTNINWEILLSNGNKLIFEDNFFNYFSEELNYLKRENIPEKIEYCKNEFIVEKDIPVIFGNSKLKIKNSLPKIIECGLDIFASSFFMITRWEEYVNKTRDIHKRFPANASIAYKYKFLQRPVVNEYVEMLWNMLKFLGYSQKRKVRKFEFIVSHDVDELKFWKNKKQLLRIILGDILKRRDILLSLERLAEYYLVKREKINDPFDTFDWIMDISEAKGIKSRFYFMSNGTTLYENRYKLKEARKTINRIIERGHIIGIHSSYNSYNNFDLFKKEKESLEKFCGINITEGRGHYLRFEVPTTWQIWDDNGMEVDSSLSYPEQEGFRCGICYPYKVFNFLTRKCLKLRERPLILMECSLIKLPYLPPEDILEKIKSLIGKVKKYNGEFVILWHNNNINMEQWTNYKHVYSKMLSIEDF